MSYNYSVSIPENNKQIFYANDNVNFMLTGDAGMSLQKNSLRIEGNLAVKIGGTVVTNEKVFFNEKCGAHGLVESCQVSTQNGLVENVAHSYPRFVRMRETATQSKNDTLQGSRACELKFPSETMTQLVAQGIKSPTDQGGSEIIDPVSFSFKPLICVNRVLSDGNISFDRVGYIRLSMILARDLSFLHGNVASASDLTYELTNLKCSYIQVPSQDADKQPVMCRSFVPMKQTFSSNLAAINSKVPSSVDSCSISFQKSADENTVRVDNSAMDLPDGMQRVEFQFNNAVEGVKYLIEDQDEMVERFLKSFNYKGHNDAFRSGRENNFGIGLNFELPKDLTSNTFNTIVTTDGVNNNNKYNIYLFFHTGLSL